MQPLVALILARAAAFDGYPHVCDGVPCGPGHETCGAPHAPAAVIHLQDPTCDMNDPNAPFVDDRGAHHVFFQKRICRSTGGAEQGPVWGHAVSKDLARWSFLPVAIWNGPEAWSAKAIYTGSATRTDDGVVVVYAGRGFPNAFGAAVPDPTFETYAKRDDPLIEKTDDDPSTAWRYEGTWRMIAKGGKMPGCDRCDRDGAPIYATAGSDFLSTWKLEGTSNLPLGECPSLFPNPGAQPGDPTHVHFYGKGQAFYHLGDWDDATLTWTTTTGRPVVACKGAAGEDPTECRRLDRGAGYYAPKDYDVGGRRIVWAWLSGVAHGCLTLPRELAYDRELGILTSNPVAELRSLRLETVARADGASLYEKPLALDWPRADAVEILVRWGGHSRKLQKGAELALSFGAGGSLSLKCDASGCATSLFKTGDAFAWKADDATLSLRIFVDPVAAEVFAQGGRVATSAPRGGRIRARGPDGQPAAVPTSLRLAATAVDGEFAESATATVRVFSLASIYEPA